MVVDFNVPIELRTVWNMLNALRASYSLNTPSTITWLKQVPTPTITTFGKVEQT